MRQLKILAFFIIGWLFFILLKLNISINFFEITLLGFILTITSLLFSFLVGYYLNSRYDRYVMIRDLHILRHSKCLNLIPSCQAFSENKNLLKSLFEKLNDIAIIDELAKWEEGYMEEPYFKKLYNITGLIKIKNRKDYGIFRHLLDELDDITDSSRKLNAIGGDKLRLIHWVLLGSLASIIIVLTLSIPITSLSSIIILMMLPPITLLSIYLIYGYQLMLFLKETTSVEINQKIFDEIGKRRFYKKERLSFVRPSVRKDRKLYRTEDELEGQDKNVYLDYLDKEFYVDRATKKKAHY